MKKEKLRFMALGFFVSALILAAFQLISPSASAQNKTNAEDVAQATEEYQQKYESLLADHEQLLNDIESSKQPPEEENKSVTAETEDEEDVTEAESAPVASPPTSFVFLVHEGQPSSVVLQNLLEAGLIDSVESAEDYLNERDLITKIQIGTYDLSTDMTDAEVLQVITLQ